MKHLRSAARAERSSTPQDTRGKRAIVVRSLVGVSVRSAADGPAYTLSPEPMTTTPILDACGRPRSVWSALLRMTRERYAALVCAVYPESTRRGAAEVLVDSLLFEATQTRAYEPLPAGGWRVWIDAKHRASVEVAP